MARDIDTGNAINVGDAVLRFLGDTTDLERAWQDLETQSTASGQKAVDSIMKMYDDLNIKGSLALRQTAQEAQEAFERLSASGVASFSDLIQAEQRVIETQIALKRSLGETIPTAVLDQLATLKLYYVELTGTAEQYAAAQKKFLTTEQAVALAAKQAASALEEEAAAKQRSQAAGERAAYNKLGITSVESLKASLEEMQLAYEELATGGKAAMSELVLAERKVLEAQMAVNRALGEGIPTEMTDQLALLRQEYVRLTGTEEEYLAAQQKFMTSSQLAAEATQRETVALEMKAQAEARAAEAATSKAYDTLGITNLEELRAEVVKTEEAYMELATGGRASLADLTKAEYVLLEAQARVAKASGEVVTPATLDRITSLKLQYIGLTGSTAEFAAAQEKLIPIEFQVAEATAKTEAAFKKSMDASMARAQKELEANSKRIIKANEVAAAEEKAAAAGSSKLGNIGSVAAGIAEYQAIMLIAGGLQEAFSAAMEFDKAFAEVSTLIDTRTPEGAMQVRMLKEQLMALPPELGDITELTKSMYEALSAGIHPGEVVKFIASSAVLAKAGLTDQFTATKLLTSVMSAYNIETNQADHVTSALMATVANGKLRLPELADAIGRVLPVAQATGVSLQELLGASDALTQGGVSAEISMTELRQVLSTIERPSKQSEKAMASLGLSFNDVRQEIKDKGLIATLQDLGARLNGNAELTAKVFGNVRALGGIFSLTGAQAQKYAEDVAAIKKAYDDGTEAQLAMDKITKSQSGEWATFGNYLKDEFLIVWNKIAPITDGIGLAVKNLTVDTGLLKLTIGALVTVALTLEFVLNTTMAVIMGLKSGVIGLAYAFEQVRFFTHAYSGSAEEFQAHLKSMKSAMDEANESSLANAHALKAGLQAFDDFVRNKPDQKMIDFAAAQKKAAQAADDMAAAQNRLKQAQASGSPTGKSAEELEKEAKAAAKAAKAFEEYAKAHKIPIAAELQEAVDKARKFYELMVSTHAPLEAQNVALANYGKALSALKSLTADNRTFGQYLADIGSGGKKLEAVTPVLVDMRVEVSETTKAYNDLVDAENKLGIKGSAAVAEHAREAEVNLATVKVAFEKGVATAKEYKDAQDTVSNANKELAISLGIDVRSAMEKVLDAEEKLGVNGTAALRRHYDELKQAFDMLKLMDKEHPGTVSAIDMQEAELKLKEADAQLKQQLGTPITGEAYNSLIKLAAALKTVHDQMQKNYSVDVAWEQFWHTKAPNTAAVMQNVADIGKSAFLGFASSFGNVVQEVESGQKSIGAAVKEAVSQTLESISGQAAVQGLMMTAEGFAALATGDEDAAGEYFLAAAEYAAVAIAAGVAGAALGSGSAAGSGSGPTSGASISSTPQSTVGPVQVQNVPRFASGALVSQPTLALIGDSKGGGSAREGVIPLDDPEAMSAIGGAIAGAMGGSGDTYNIQGIISADTLDKVIDNINSRVRAGKQLNATAANRVTKRS